MSWNEENIRIYAISDSHQETRKTCRLLSKILEDEDDNKNVILLHCGDIFKGIYPCELERSSYLKLKELKPDIEIILTLGNNDFGFNKQNIEYLIDTVKLFKTCGIKTVCANIFNLENIRPDWILPYTIINKNNLKIFITGFCINNINSSEFGIVAKKQYEVLDEIKDCIFKEKPDSVIVLNHDYMESSKELEKKLSESKINTTLIIGGHNHEPVNPDESLNIYYPRSFGESMYKMDLCENKIKNVKTIHSAQIENNCILNDELNKFEESTKLFDVIAPYVLNLPKYYSKPSPLGSFLADNMKEVSNSDIAFFSTGFLMKPLEYHPFENITNYNFKKTIIAETPIKKIELNTEELKNIFSHALESNGWGSSNPRFLQCSNNIKIKGKNNIDLKKWELKQIYVNDNPLLDEELNPIDKDKKYICAIDSYIANGGQGYNILKKIKKWDVIKDNEAVKIDKVLLEALINASKKYQKGANYPCFKIIEDI